jgi:hypothetical protein
MAGTASELHAGLAKLLASIPGLRVADHLPEQLSPPQAIIQLDQVDYHRAMSGGLSDWRFVVVMVAGRMGERSAQAQLDGWLSYDGEQSVRAALESDPTLGGAAQTVKVTRSLSVRPLVLGELTYISVELNVDVTA